MNTPRVKKQQEQLRKPLSAKKGLVKGLRNVLGQPHETRWPILSSDEGSRLEELLIKGLLGLSRRTVARKFFPWSQLRMLHKKDRRAIHKKFSLELKQRKLSKPPPNDVVLGINAVTRGLEKEELCSILLDSGVEPLLIKHVILMAQTKKIPILLVPFLKTASLNSYGFASASMGLKKGAMDLSNSFYEVYQEIVKFSQVVPEKEITVDNLVESKTKDVEVNVESKNSVTTCFSLPISIYKYRNTTKERTFVPPGTTPIPSNGDESPGDFIALGEEDPEPIVFQKDQRYMDVDENEAKRRGEMKNTSYLPLKVKRIQGNNNRVKATKLAKPKKKKVSNKK